MQPSWCVPTMTETKVVIRISKINILSNSIQFHKKIYFNQLAVLICIILIRRKMVIWTFIIVELVQSFKKIWFYLSQCKNTLLRSDATTLDHDKILFNFTIMRKATHWINRFIGQIIFGGCIVLDQFSILGVETIANVVDFLVDFGTMMVTFLSSTCNRELNSWRMPCTNTSYFA